MSPLLLIAADVLVAILLAASIGSSIMLSRRITKLKANEGAMRQVIAELIHATGTAERAIAGLRDSVSECDLTLAQRLRKAEASSEELANKITMSEASMMQMMQIMAASHSHVTVPAAIKPPPSPPVLSPEEMRAQKLGSALDAAQALADRALKRLERQAA